MNQYPKGISKGDKVNLMRKCKISSSTVEHSISNDIPELLRLKIKQNTYSIHYSVR